MWFLDPVHTGKYPDAFVDGVPYEEMGWKTGDEERLRTPLDFSGMNFYGARTLIAAKEGWELLPGLKADGTIRKEQDPSTMERACLWMANRYSRPVVITETGFWGRDVITAQKTVHDRDRIAWLRDAFSGIRRAPLKGAKIVSVHVWSLIDDWEWQGGFKEHLGLAWVDFANPAERIPKDSAQWYGGLIKTRRLSA